MSRAGWQRWARLAAVLLACCLPTCKRAPEPAPEPAPSAPASVGAPASSASAAPSAARAARAPASGFRFPAAARIVAFGDVHGDLSVARAALKLAGAINDQDEWVGGQLVVVQTGDQLDRGDDDRAILDLFDSLTEQARAAGGAFHALNGNHETMNVSGDFRHVTPGALKSFEDITATGLLARAIRRFPLHQQGRAAAFLPGGVYARRMAKRKVAIVVGDTVFVHGGILPHHVTYGIDRINNEVSEWMLAQRQPSRDLVSSDTSPLWARVYSAGDPGAVACKTLGRALAALSAARMVVGHTIQKDGIDSGCEQRIWRIDVGMSAHYGGSVAVLEIQGAQVRARTAEAN